MPLFNDPMEPRGLYQRAQPLLRYGASLLALMGWCTMALGLAQQHSELWWLAALGLLSSLLAARFALPSAVVELTLLAAGISLLPSHALSWGLTAAALTLMARALSTWLSIRARGT